MTKLSLISFIRPVAVSEALWVIASSSEVSTRLIAMVCQRKRGKETKILPSSSGDDDSNFTDAGRRRLSAEAPAPTAKKSDVWELRPKGAPRLFFREPNALLNSPSIESLDAEYNTQLNFVQGRQ